MLKERRPKTRLTEEQERIIEEVWKEMRVEVRLLCYELRKREYSISLNKMSLNKQKITVLYNYSMRKLVFHAKKSHTFINDLFLIIIPV